MTTFVAYAALAFAILMEVAGTLCLGKSAQFTRLAPSLGCVVCYVTSFYLLSQALRGIPLTVAYASWSGVGIILTAAVGIMVFKQRLDLAAVIGISLIIAGVVIVNGFSKMMAH